jgi:hypothetical protein
MRFVAARIHLYVNAVQGEGANPSDGKCYFAPFELEPMLSVVDQCPATGLEFITSNSF